MVFVLVLCGIALGLNHIYQWYPWPWSAPPPAPPAATAVKPPPPPEVIDYAKIKEQSDTALTDMIKARKDSFGLTESVDMVVGPEESIRVGEETVSLSDILAQIEGLAAQGDSTKSLPVLASDGRPVMQELTEGGTIPTPPATPTKPNRSPEFYGVYVVRSGDNLWDIHFHFLREYLRARGIEIADNADEVRQANGTSSGVSRILKYAESMVHIFNMKTRTLDKNLDLLEPEQKVVVFNLSHLHRILGSIKPDQIDQVQFDGKELYLPGDKPEQNKPAT